MAIRAPDGANNYMKSRDVKCQFDRHRRWSKDRNVSIFERGKMLCRSNIRYFTAKLWSVQYLDLIVGQNRPKYQERDLGKSHQFCVLKLDMLWYVWSSYSDLNEVRDWELIFETLPLQITSSLLDHTGCEFFIRDLIIMAGLWFFNNILCSPLYALGYCYNAAPVVNSILPQY